MRFRHAPKVPSSSSRSFRGPSSPGAFSLRLLSVPLIALIFCACAVLLPAQQAEQTTASPTVIPAHDAEVSAAEYTPDGRILATSSYDGTQKLWDPATGEPLRSFSGHANLVLSLAMHPDGTMFATGGNDNTVKLWDIPARAAESSWPGHAGAIRDLSVRPDGSFVVSVGEDGIVRLWDRAGGELLQSLEGHSTEVVRTVFRNDGNQWVTGDVAGVVNLWTPGKYLDEDPTARRTLHAHPAAVSGIAWHPNNQILLTAGVDGTVKQWQFNPPPHRLLAAAPEAAAATAVDQNPKPPANEPDAAAAMAAGKLSAGQHVAVAANSQWYVSGGPDGIVRAISAANGQLRELADQPGPVSSVTISANSTLTATGSETGAIKLWNLADGADRLQLLGHVGPVHSVRFHPDSARLASAGDDGTVRLWKLPTPPQVLAGHQQLVNAVAFSPNGQYAVTTGRDNSVRLWNGASGAAVAAGAGHLAAVQSTTFRADSTQFATGDQSGILKVWNGTNAAALGSLGAHTAAVTDIAWHPAGERLVTTAADGTAKLWELPLIPPRTFSGHAAAVNAVDISRDGKLVVSASADQTLRLFDPASGNQVRQLAAQTGPLTAVRISPDDAIAAAANATGTILFRRLSDAGDLLAVAGHEGPVHSLEFRPDGQQIASAGADGTVRLWSLPHPPLELTGHTMPVQAAAVTPDGKVIVTAGQDKSIRLWNPTDGKATAIFSGHEEAAGAVAIRPDGVEGVSGDAGGTLRFWNLADAAAGPIAGAHTGPVRTIAWHPTGSRLLTGGADGALKLWQLPITPPAMVAGHSSAVTSVALSADGKLLVTGGMEGRLQLDRPGTDAPAAVLAEQPGPVTALTLAKRDSLIVSGSNEGAVTAWTAKDGEPAFTFQAHPSAVTGVAWQPSSAGPEAAAAQTPPGAMLATVGEDGTLRIWSPPVTANAFESHQQQTTGLVSSRDGKLLATSGRLNGRPAINILDSATGKRIASLFGHTAAIRSMQFSTDGRRLISGAEDNTARVWDLSDPKFPEIAIFAEHETPVTAVALSPDGKSAVSGAADKSLRIWNVDDANLLHDLAGHTAAIIGLVTLPDGTAVSAGDTSLRFWNPADGKQVRTITGPSVVTGLGVSPDGTQLIAGFADNSLTAYNPANGQPLFQLTGHAAPVRSIAFNPDGSRIVSRSGDGGYRVWEKTGRLREARILESGPEVLAAGQQRAAYLTHEAVFGPDSESLILLDPGHAAGTAPLLLKYLIAPAETPLHDVAFLPDGSGILTAGADKLIRLWNPLDGKQVRQYAGPTDAVTAVAVSPDGMRVLAGSLDKTVRIWNTADAAAVTTLTMSSVVRDVSLSRDGARLAVVGDDGLTRVEDLASGKTLQRFTGHEGSVAGVAFGEDGNTFTTAGADKSVRNWTIAARRIFVAGDGSAAVRHAAWLDDGDSFAAITEAEKIVRIWNSDTGEIKELAAGEMPLSSLAVHPGGTTVAAGSIDQKVYQWAVAEAKPGSVLETSAPVVQLAYSPVTRGEATSVDLLVGGADNIVRVFDAASGGRLEEFPTAAPPAILVPLAQSASVVTSAAGNAAGLHRCRLQHILEAHTDGAHALAWSADGKTLCSGGADPQIRIWNAESGALERTLSAVAKSADQPAAPEAPAPGEPSPLMVTSLSVAAEGTRLFASTNRNIVQMWDLTAEGDAAKAPLAVFPHDNPVVAARPSEDGSRLATLTANNIVRVYDVARQLELERFDSGLPDGQSLNDLAFAPDRRTLLAAGSDNLIRAWHVSAVRLLEAHSGPANAVAFVGEGNHFATAGDDGIVRLWPMETEELKPAMELKGSTAALADLVVDPAGAFLTAGGLDQTLYTWKLADGSLTSSIATPAAITGLASGGDPAKLAVAAGDRSVRIYSLPENRVLEEIRVPLPEAAVAADPEESTPPVLRVAVSPDGGRILVNSANQGRIIPLSVLQVITGHSGSVTDVAFTPDGTRLVTGGIDRSLRLWQIADGTLVRAWLAHEAAVTGVVITPDGETILSSSLDQSVRAWPINLPEAAANDPAAAAQQSPPAAKELSKLEPVVRYTHPAGVMGLQPSADGKRIATAAADGFVRVWDVATSRELERFAGHDGTVSGVAFVPDNLRIVSGGTDNTIREWRTTATRIIVAHPAAVTGLAWLPNGTRFFTAGADGLARAWDQNFNPVGVYGLPQPAGEAEAGSPEPEAAEQPAESPQGPVPAGHLTALAVRPDSRQLAAIAVSGEGDAQTGRVLIWNIADMALVRTITLPAPASGLDYSADNQKLLVACSDQSVRIYTADEGELQQQISTEQEIHTAEFSPDGRRILLGGAGADLQTWRYVSPIAVRSLTGHQGGVYGVRFSPDGTRLASCSLDGTIRLWDPATGQQQLSLAGHEGGVTSIDVSPDGALLVSAGIDGTVRLWDATGGRQLKQLAATTGPVYSVDFNSDGKLIAAAGADKLARVFNTTSGALQATLKQHDDHIYRVAFNPGGNKLLTCGYGGELLVWNPAGGEPLMKADVSRVALSASWSPDGKTIVVSGGEGRVHFVDVPPAAR